jgi:hypothetical protein
MRAFSCEHCGRHVRFDAQRCPNCDAELGYDAVSHAVCELLPTAAGAAFTLHHSGRLHWRCLNSAWGCNGIVFAHTAAVWCRSCSLTRGRPDEERSDALNAWVHAEAAKRRVIHHLDELGLRFRARSSGAAHGLAFDFVSLPGVGGITGFADGVVTIDLAEVDDAHRDAIRRQFGERFRTVLGHLRHELGHFFFGVLVPGDDDLAAFRDTFGDERIGYRAALDEHYLTFHSSWDADRYVSSYASSHPVEDWAETFAAYLQLLDLVDTAVARGLVDDPDHVLTGRASTIDLDAVRRAWRDLAPALDDLGAALGGHSGFPPDLSDGVFLKLVFLHGLVVRHVEAATTTGAGQPT